MIIDALNQSSDVYYLMDPDQRFIFSNAATFSMSGYISEEAMINTSYYHMRCPAVECADIFVEQDREAIRQKKSVKMIGINQYHGGEWVVLFGSKTPIYNKNQLIGVMSHFTPITNSALINLPFLLESKNHSITRQTPSKQRNFIIQESFEKQNLSKRESECLFYLLRGFSARMTADKLQISPKTIEYHINNIKIKLQCDTKSQLIEKALSLGLGNVLLQDMLPF